MKSRQFPKKVESVTYFDFICLMGILIQSLVMTGLAARQKRSRVFFGTSTFLIGQTVVVGLWIAVNMTGLTKFDVYPFILLNLMFSLQAAYAAPLILLAQTRQADRDKALTEADAQHREALAVAAEQRAGIAVQQTERLMALMRQNTELTELVKSMSERIQAMTAELHQKMIQAT